MRKKELKIRLSPQQRAPAAGHKLHKAADTTIGVFCTASVNGSARFATAARRGGISTKKNWGGGAYPRGETYAGHVHEAAARNSIATKILSAFRASRSH